MQALRVSNNLYGSDVAPAHELAKVYTRQIVHGTRVKLPLDTVHAFEELVAKRKQHKILRSLAVKDGKVKTGDIVNFFVKHGHQKRDVHSISKPVLKYDATSRPVTVTGVKEN